ncbi:hypothetical protein AnaeK_0087 [Anaeromyxobacter sp. K]|uniref:carboxypeptidase regulatory-like domain-containing protein n=1 Tax=Anaeromyxobacter sp. (strain K) TaxID=447217 RepID=UPI00015F9BCA|nr:carboxypeptidase regulatory-like domain-containing protein [Anaeromyxobacter sp. K]ACG71330.1 hypothetical protein AnaeK_0087 [Anaeromyxobacter sp. K]
MSPFPFPRPGARAALAPAALVLVAALAACGGGGGGGGSSPPPPPPPPGGASTVLGAVTDARSGARLAGVTVTAAGRTAVTDAAGEFTLTGLAAGDVRLTFTKEGYAPSYAGARSGDRSEAVLATLKREGARQPYDPSTARTFSEVTEAGPYAVILPAGSLDTAATELEVTITPVDPSKETAVLPGELVAGSAGGTVLAPVTFAEFSIYEPSGRRVNLKPSASAVVELPIPPALRPRYPLGTVIHCYSYDPATGAWEDFVEGTVARSSVDGETPVLRAAIRHFSWYGAAPEGNECADLYGRVVSAVDGRPLPNARVEAFPGTTAYTDANGNFQVVALRDGASSLVAYQTGFDLDGSLTGMPGAKYIEFGKVDDLPLTGLVARSCAGGAALAGAAGEMQAAAAGVGTPADPLLVRVGVLSKLSYEVTAWVDANGAAALVSEGVPGPDGELVDPQPTDGAVITVTGPDGAHALPLAAEGTGVFSAAFTGEPGRRYTITVDANGDGAVDGTGFTYLVGEPAFTSPAEGATLDAAGLRAAWTDAAVEAGTADADYAPLYWAAVTAAAEPWDGDFYWGSDRGFDVRSLVSGEPLAPGAYSAAVLALCGPYAAAGQDVALVKNVTGAGISGEFFSFAAGTEVGFTVR